MVGSRIGEKYEIVSRVAQGGMAVVYKARQVALDRTVAIKVIRPAGHPDDDARVKRFLKEAERASLLMSPHSVRIYDFGDEPDGTLYMVMEFVEGQRLSDLIAHCGLLSEKTTLHIACQVCEVLREAHGLGVIHRDLKPLNIMIQPECAGIINFVKVLDFGVSKSLFESREALTDTNVLLGTPQYMSPEQCRGHPMDARSDIYSLGVVLFEMLAGKPPFTSDDRSFTPILLMHLNNPLPAIAAVNPHATPSAEMERLVRKALAKNPDERFADVRVILTELERLGEKYWPKAGARALRPAASGAASATAGTGPAASDRERPATGTSRGSPAAQGGTPAGAARAGTSPSGQTRAERVLVWSTIVALLIALAGASYIALGVSHRRSGTAAAKGPRTGARVAAEALFSEAEALRAGGMLPAARTTYLRSLERDATFPLPHLGLARMALAQDSLDEAEYHYRSCREKARNQNEFTYAAKEATNGQKNLVRVTALLRQATELARAAAGCERALAVFDEVLQLSPGNLRANLEMTRCYAELGNRQAACEHLRAALTLSPSDGTAARYEKQLECGGRGGG